MQAQFSAPSSWPANNAFLRLGIIGNSLVGGIAIALHHAAVMLKQFQSVNGAATGSIAVGHRRRVSPAPRPVVAGDGPEVSLLGAPATGIEHRRHRLIDRDLA